MSDEMLRPLRLFVSRQRWLAFAVLILICGNSLLSVAPAFLGGRVVQYLPEHDITNATRYALLMLAAIIVSGVAGAAEGYLVSLAGERFARDTRARIYGHLLRLPLSFVLKRTPGEMMNRVDSDVDALTSAIVTSIEPTIGSIIGFGVTLAVMVVADWRLTLVAVATVPLWALTTAPASRPLADLRARLMRAHDVLASVSNETLSAGGVLIVKSAGSYASETERFRAAFGDMMSLRLRAALLTRGLQSLLTVIAGIGPALILIAGAWSAYHGHTSIATLVAFLSLQGRLYAPVGQLANLRLQLATLRAVVDRINEVLQEPQETNGGARMPAGHALDARGVSYDAAGRTIVEPISFSIPPGASVALVGPSGSGKTSLALLLAGLQRPTRGALALGGAPAAEIPLDVHRANVLLVPQHSFFFTRSIRENLSVFAPGASDDAIRAALDVTHARAIVDALPDGLDTVVGTATARLSGGELQRLALARALLARPPVLVLDESTSALDASTEDAVLRALAEHPQLSTVVYVTHRPERLPRIDLTVDLAPAALAAT